MPTTALFVEILIVGLEAGAWMLLLLLTLVERPSSEALPVKEWAALVTALTLAAAYVLGILIDRAADSLYQWFGTTRAGAVTNRYFGEDSRRYTTPSDIATMRLTVMKESDGMARFLDYQRSRARIARATVLNLLAAVPACLLYLGVNDKATRSTVLATLIAGGVLTALSLFAAERIHSAYIRRLSDAYRIVVQSGAATHGR